MKDIYALEKEYLDAHPGSGYITDILSLEECLYPYIAMSKQEYRNFVQGATELVVEAIERYKEKRG